MNEKADAVALANVTGDIKFLDVTFKYGEKMPLVLNELNLHIKSGERVAFIGPSGGGKTTLIKLLLRLYDPLCGESCSHFAVAQSLLPILLSFQF